MYNGSSCKIWLQLNVIYNVYTYMYVALTSKTWDTVKSSCCVGRQKNSTPICWFDFKTFACKTAANQSRSFLSCSSQLFQKCLNEFWHPLLMNVVYVTGRREAPHRHAEWQQLWYSNFEEYQRLTEPTFDNNTISNVTVQLGGSAFLHCRVRNLGERTVSGEVRIPNSVLSLFYHVSPHVRCSSFL